MWIVNSFKNSSKKAEKVIMKYNTVFKESSKKYKKHKLIPSIRKQNRFGSNYIFQCKNVYKNNQC